MFAFITNLNHYASMLCAFVVLFWFCYIGLDRPQMQRRARVAVAGRTEWMTGGEGVIKK
jgi:preprotein translocase subunit YajC